MKWILNAFVYIFLSRPPKFPPLSVCLSSVHEKINENESNIFVSFGRAEYSLKSSPREKTFAALFLGCVQQELPVDVIFQFPFHQSPSIH